MPNSVMEEFEQALEAESPTKNRIARRFMLLGAKWMAERCAVIVANAHKCEAPGCDEKEQFIETAEEIRLMSTSLEEKEG